MTQLGPIRFPWEVPPAFGTPVEVAPGLLWIRLPMPMALDHVNVYALDDGDGWTLVDTGLNTPQTIEIWQDLLDGPLAAKPVRRILLTHHHPDHCGMVGWFQQRGAELVTSRTAWLMARMLLLDEQDRPVPEALRFWERAGMSPEQIAKRAGERPFNFADVVQPIPVGFTRLQDGDSFHAGGRDWDVRVGHGHAPEHLTLWSRDDNLVLGGDQLLPGISPNIGVHPTEPGADPLGEWLTATARFAEVAREDQLVLGGHNLPFTGLPIRLRQMAENHHSALDRLRALLTEPQVAVDCFPVLFKRRINAGTFGLALAETVAHLNYLYRRGQITRRLRADGAWLWQIADGA
ncbi:MBL fold metallo-hydrolase [Pseudooceanicola algae]|uniref:Metallo-beta-lactamase domain-containing protein n=1 Tax=Pseudooceanicola algae TaxID=1537215 RepID=A0A418SKM8_9RHOB|nr:MBL fold metallo-hydrolase [Pseudooceanicola algae]QPM90711.1 hypothetical protein PSAL_019500 [Pseudooceanicola algae]